MDAIPSAVDLFQNMMTKHFNLSTTKKDKQMRVYLANLRKYNEGQLVGKWVDLPQDDIEEALKFTDNGDEWLVHDHEGFSFEVGEVGPAEVVKLNEYAQLVDEDEGKAACAGFILYQYPNTKWEDVMRQVEEEAVEFYAGQTLEDMAGEILDSDLDSLPPGYEKVKERISMYFDYSSLAHDLELEGWTENPKGLPAGCYLMR